MRVYVNNEAEEKRKEGVKGEAWGGTPMRRRSLKPMNEIRRSR